MKLKIILFAFAIGLTPLHLHAQTRLIFTQPLTSLHQAQMVPKGEKVAMACTKCKTVQVCDVDKKGAFLDWFTPKTKHVCRGCGGHWAPRVSYGIERHHSHWLHTCSKCGDKSVFCCSTEVGKKTLGM